jgi:tRNA dimethylallyltransferase
LGGGDAGVVVGPTAAGKSAVAMWLAERRPLTIVSADSRQIYRRFDIGTAKPSRKEREDVPHFGIDIVEPTERYSAFAWADSAVKWISAARAGDRAPLIVGGTGLYIRTLAEAGFHEPELDGALRAALQRLTSGWQTEELRRWARRLDAGRAHLGRTQLIRCIEVALLTGRRLSDLHRESYRPPRISARYLLVDPGRALGSRIALRAEKMLAGGWKEEVAQLSVEVPGDAPAWKATGYRAVRALVAGEMDERSALDEIVIATRQYAKRQRTWFRHQLPADRVTTLDTTAEGWCELALRWFDSLNSLR